MSNKEEVLRKLTLAAEFLREQHKGLTSKQVELSTQITMLLVLNQIKPDEDLIVALQATIDYIEFMEGLNR